MKRIIGTMILMFGITQIAFGNTVPGPDSTNDDLERSHRFALLGGLYGWNDVDNDSIIVWVRPSRPYLIELSRKSPGLRFANTIAITSTAGYVYEKFDSVIVDGLRYPIQSIYKLDRKSARKIQKHS